ncbi:MAG: molybdate ABC transporter substrate-binding protein [Hyphomicrobiaceae bacterium]
MKRLLMISALTTVLTGGGAAAETVNLYAAGSLKAALGDVARAFEAASPGHRVATTFAASGLLRGRIEAGEQAHVFASANMAHPKKLADAGTADGPVRRFATNRLCALTQGGLGVKPETLLARMLDAKTRVGTSTPKADPSGDYAFQMFAKAEAVHPGARAALEAKAMQLTGGPTSEKAPAGRNQYGWVMSSGKADIFLTYCTNAVLARKDTPSLEIVRIPEQLAVGADYGLIVMKNAPAAAAALAELILAPTGQKILAGYGFGPAK